METRRLNALSATDLLPRYYEVRGQSERLCEPLVPEDCVIQTMPDVSPTRWHLAHTTWFFETFLLAKQPGYRSPQPEYEYLFNSYYNTVGEQYPRPQRGLLSRPTLSEIFSYRQQIDERVSELLAGDAFCDEDRLVVELGLQHEQQHQELMLTDIKHVLSCNPLYPVYVDRDDVAAPKASRLQWHAGCEGVHEIGCGTSEFAFDNERPRHRTLLHPHRLASRLTTNGEYLAFLEAGGYRRPELWLSLGWDRVQQEGWQAPLYWTARGGAWYEFTLSGLRPLDMDAPVCHVSYFEADAFARWADARLPTEAEWECAAEPLERVGTFVESGRYHPAPCRVDQTTVQPASQPPHLQQMFGDVWQWTASPYLPYPGYKTPAGALGEYNGKFMCNQFVLRGGSCATPESHVRVTYRNFFPPDARWQFSGIRLACHV